MSDTPRTRPELVAILADNETGDISAQDMRDQLASLYLASEVDAALSGKADTAHTHTQSEIVGLASALAGKSDVGHLHVVGSIPGLQATLDGKAGVEHTHTLQSLSSWDILISDEETAGDVVAFRAGELVTPRDGDTQIGLALSESTFAFRSGLYADNLRLWDGSAYVTLTASGGSMNAASLTADSGTFTTLTTNTINAGPIYASALSSEIVTSTWVYVTDLNASGGTIQTLSASTVSTADLSAANVSTNSLAVTGPLTLPTNSVPLASLPASVSDAVARRAHPGFAATLNYHPATKQISTATNVATSNTMYFLPFIVSQATAVTRYTYEATGVVGAGQVRIGLYANANGIPASLVWDSGAMGLSNPGVYNVTAPANQVLTPGVWWVSFVTNAISATMRSGTNSNHWQVGTPNYNSINNAAGYVREFVTPGAALPATNTVANFATGVTNNSPIIAIVGAPA